MPQPRVFAGTSGYDKPWKGTFYPKDIKKAGMLAYYAERLPIVEINNTFYRLPKREVIENWSAQTPDHFRFAIKASRRITHIKRLNDVAEPTAYLFEVSEHLGAKLGPILFQMPPNAKKNLDRLKAFLGMLPGERRVTFEFRHPSWFEADVFDALRDHGAALCIAESEADEQSAPFEATTDWGYLRLRKDAYEAKELDAWIARILEQKWREVFVFCKGEEGGQGPRLAREIMDLAASKAGFVGG